VDNSLLYRVITEQATAAERRAVETWRAASRANESRYRELAVILQGTRQLTPITSSPPPVLDVLRTAANRSHGRRRRYWTRTGLGLIAATLALTTALTLRQSHGDAPPEQFGFEELVTGAEQTVTVALRDGSVMRLAPLSRARIPVHEGTREVHLVGRAFFSVARRNGTPFTVRTQGGDVTVLGTQFDVDARNDDVRLLVVEGKVALSAVRGGETYVERNQEARVVDGQLRPTLVEIPTARDSSRWVGRFLAFQGTPLQEVANEISRAYGVRVTIADSSLTSQTVTSWFSDRSLEDVVRIVCTIVAMACEVEATDVRFGKSP
jgi:ferric-dicitrate binding protein FerR (iron transport regulator)